MTNGGRAVAVHFVLEVLAGEEGFEPSIS